MDIRTYYEEQRGLMCTAMRESLPYLRRLLRMDAEQFAAVLGIHEQELADIEGGRGARCDGVPRDCRCAGRCCAGDAGDCRAD